MQLTHATPALAALAVHSPPHSTSLPSHPRPTHLRPTADATPTTACHPTLSPHIHHNSSRRRAAPQHLALPSVASWISASPMPPAPPSPSSASTPVLTQTLTSTLALTSGCPAACTPPRGSCPRDPGAAWRPWIESWGGKCVSGNRRPCWSSARPWGSTSAGSPRRGTAR